MADKGADHKPSHGRRAGGGAAPAAADGDDAPRSPGAPMQSVPDSDAAASPRAPAPAPASDSQTGGAPVGGRHGRQGGWDSGPSEEQREQQAKEEQRKLEEASRHWGSDEVAGVDSAAAIPSIDGPEKEAEGEDITGVVAEAPRNYNTAVQGPTELDKEALPHIPDTGGDAGVDTLILQQCICPVRDTEDEHWSPEQLFHDLAIQLQREKDERTEEAEGEKSADAKNGPGSVGLDLPTSP
eukprot:TRINITY_DN47590_c0_g1_i1.p2 TRINITY_DN47590_c0_g1~~TRINITY_DN47590_c0_g1_i1.p2  ORF type:complete len:240 (+),score=74.93 TRINITY_DN47590_c0_g1_i1:105-824(+)